jgi:ADP-glucose pyrophosphorylase
MTTNSNIYDIDGEILRKAGDTEELSIDEAQKRVTSYQEKLKELDPKDPKVSIYNTYIRNLQSYIFNQYILHPELMPTQNNTTQDEIKKALEELKAEAEKEEKETVMDEYVEPIEEVNG